MPGTQVAELWEDDQHGTATPGRSRGWCGRSTYATANGSGDYANGKLRTATRHNWIARVDNQVVETYTYGGTGGAASQRATTAEGQSVSQGFTWTDLGLPGSVTYPQIAGIGPARTVSDTYTNGFLTSVPSYATGITYSVNSMPYQITHANNVVATYGLDANKIQRVAGITTTGGSSNNLALTPFAYDGAGDVKAIGSQTFVYDKVSRLVTANILANNIPKTQSAAFDAFGNITSTTTTDWGTQTFSLNAATNRLNSPVTYDAAGDITSWGGFSYTWDALGKMQTVTGTGINHTYLYTADGERISDRDSLAGTTTLTVRGLDGKVLRIYVKSGSTWSWSKDYVYQQGMLLAAVDTSTTRYFQLDHLGTPRLITGSGGTTLAIHDYYPFGMEAYGTADGERMKFTGHELDGMGTTGQGDDLYNMHARYYNSNIARFISADPLRGDPHSPQSFNLFAYVQGSPVVFVDPFGLQALNGISGGTSFDLFFDANPYQAWFANPANYTQVLPSVYPTGWWGPMDSYWGWQHANWWSAPYAFGSSPVASSGWAPGGTSSVPTNSALAGGSLPPISGMPGPVPINVSYSVELQFTLSLGFFKSWTGLALPIPAVIAGGLLVDQERDRLSGSRPGWRRLFDHLWARSHLPVRCSRNRGRFWRVGIFRGRGVCWRHNRPGIQ